MNGRHARFGFSAIIALLAAFQAFTSASAADRMKRFNDAKFGLFIHWGLYSIPAEGEWVMNRKKIPVAQYNKLADDFSPPGSFSPESWVKLAKKAGMRYAVLTTRHHDGFCLWDTKTTDFNSVKTAAKRDFVREFADACRRHGIKVGFYFSLRNWQFDVEKNGKIVEDEWRRQVACTHAALRELMTDYGKIDVLWYDGCSAPGCCDGEAMDRLWKTKKLNAMVRSLQPEIVINDRSCRSEDYSTPEQSVTPPPRGRAWESCMTLNRSWGYKTSDTDWKSADDIWRSLLHCCRFGGNYLLNIGPRADGSVPEESVKVLEEIGRRVKAARRGIYGSVRDGYTEATHAAGVVTKTPAGYTLFAFNDAPLDGEATREKIADGVYAVTLKPGAKPCNLLGGRHDVAVKAGDAPVLGDNSAEEQPPYGELVTDGALLKMVDGAKAAGYAPGVASRPYFGRAVDVPLPAQGDFLLEIGVIAPRGYPDTVTVNVPSPGPESRSGAMTFRWKIPEGWRVYALRLTPAWKIVPPARWEVAGVFPSPFFEKAATGENLREAFAPAWAAKAKKLSFTPMPARNALGDHSDRRVNFAYCAPVEGIGLGLARLKIPSGAAKTVLACLGVDWWADVYVNGVKAVPLKKLAKKKGDPEFTTHTPAVFRLPLKAGGNEILVVNHAGSRSNWLSMWTNLK